MRKNKAKKPKLSLRQKVFILYSRANNPKNILIFLLFSTVILKFTSLDFLLHITVALAVYVCAYYYPKAAALIMTLGLSVFNSKGLFSNPEHSVSFLVRTVFYFSVVFIVDYFKYIDAQAGLERRKQVGNDTELFKDLNLNKNNFEIKDALDNLLKLIENSLKFKTAIFFIYDEKLKILKNKLAVSSSRYLKQNLELALNTGLIGNYAAKNEKKYISDFSQNVNVLQIYNKEEFIKSVAVIPVRVNNVLKGVFYADSSVKDAFCSRMNFLESTASAYFYMITMLLNEEDTRKILYKYRLLLNVQKDLNECAFEKEKVETVTINYVKRFVEAESYFIVYPEKIKEGHLFTERMKIINNVTDYVLKNKTSIRINNIHGEMRFLSGVTANRLNSKFNSIMAVPVIAEDIVLCVIFMESGRVNNFYAVDEQALNILASQIATVILTTRKTYLNALKEKTLRNLGGIYESLAEDLDFNKLPASILNVFLNICSKERGVIYYIEDKTITPLARVKISDDFDLQFDRNSNFKKSVISKNIVTVDSTRRDLNEFSMKSFAKSKMYIPLMKNSRVIAIAELWGNTEGGFSNIDGALIEKLRFFCGTLLAESKISYGNYLLSITDPLTNLYNYRYLEENLRDSSQKLYNKIYVNLTIMVIDIDFFKAFNDKHGHLAGDYALRKVANILKKNIRDNDILCRYGGEEFVMIMPDLNQNEINSIANRIKNVISKEESFGMYYGGANLTVSIGVASYSDNIEINRLLEKADKALFQAKKEGRNRVCVAGVS